MKKSLFIFLLSCISFVIDCSYDVTLIGRMAQADGLIRFSIGIIDHLHNQLKINFIPAGTVNFNEVPLHVQNVASNQDKRGGNIALLLDHPWNAYDNFIVDLVPQESKIKIAYSMFETTKIPDTWVRIFNTRFDAVVVPDEFLVDVYRKNGVTIPLFVLPLGLYLQDFLNKPIKKYDSSRPFIFGTSASFWERKNTPMILDAFAKQFGNNPKVKLRIHSRGGGSARAQNVLFNKLKKLNLKNVEFSQATFTHKEYVDYLYSLDCYVLLSKGEGYSVGPREAMALGVPCILANNSAHGTICKSGLVRIVESTVLEAARDYLGHFKDQCGFVYNCKLVEARRALQEVYDHYQIYKKNDQASRAWAQQYDYKKLTARYMGLLKPQKVILGNKNYIGENYLETTSVDLYEKYRSILNETK